MPKSVILVPTFDRPEMLFLSLERIQQAIRPAGADLWIAPETRQGHVSDPLYSIVTATFRDLWPRLQVAPSHHYLGNSYNVLSALKAAYQAGYDYTFVIEDDVLIAKDFFAWHLAVLAKGPYFCSVGRASPRSFETEKEADPEIYYLTSTGYTALGVCFPRASLAAIVPHAIPAYFSDMPGYCQANFPDPRTAHEECEQDGLVLRVMVAQGGQEAYPSVPRSFHAGYYGYHRKVPSLQGTLAERVAFLRELLAQPEHIATLSPFSDVHPCSLEPGVWTEPHLTLYPNDAKPKER